MASANESGYYGTYEKLVGVTDEASEFLRSNAAQIGSRLTITLDSNEKGDPLAIVSSERSGQLGRLSQQVASHLHMLARRGWEFTGTLSLIWYDKESERLSAEVGVIAYIPEYADAIRSYTDRLFERVARGEHPTMRLTDEELALVLSSGSTWNSAKTVKPPTFKKGSGSFAYQDRRTLTQTLSEAAIEGRVGCKIGTVAFYVVIAIVVILIVKHFMGW